MGGRSKTKKSVRSKVGKEQISSLGNRKGFYCDALVNGKSITFLCDTGANVSILNRKMIELLPDSVKPKILPVGSKMVTVTGESKPFLGKATFDIKLGDRTFQQEMLLSDIVEDGILGMDFMKTQKCDLIISKNCMRIKGEDIPCYMKNSSNTSCCRVALIEDVELSPDTEVVITGKILDHIDRDQSCVVEGVDKFMQKTGLLVAKVLVEPKTGRIPIRIANLTDKPIKIFKNTVTAMLESVEVDKNENVRSAEVDSSVKAEISPLLPEHLKDLYEKSCINLDKTQSQILKQFLIKHQNVFSKDSNDIGHSTLVKHKIDTGNAKPVKKYPYRIPLAKRKVAEDEIKKMEKDGIIEKCSQSAWNAPIVMITKRDGSIRFCCDFRGLNECTIKDSQPLPRIDDSIEALAGSKWWSCLDMKSGYWQVDIDESDRHKTAFSIPGGEQWQWRRLAFGLCNSPATFTRLMQMVFSGLLWKTVIIYLDDIICQSKTFEGQLSNLEEVFNRLSNAGLKLNAKKCILFQTQVTFLGHTISENGVGTSPDKIKTVQDWPTPKNSKEARSFISLASYYRSYVYQFAKLAKPIHELSENGRKFVWTAECAESFRKIKEALTTAPILAFPTENDHFILDCDASLTAQGAVLSQVQNGEEKVIGYFSKCFTRTERKYCVTRRELLAVVNAMKHFHHYVYGRKITIRSDHSSLKWLLSFKNVEGQLARWLTFLSAYDFEIIHRAGRLHSNADILSRRPCADKACKYCERVECRMDWKPKEKDEQIVEGQSVCSVSHVEGSESSVLWQVMLLIVVLMTNLGSGQMFFLALLLGTVWFLQLDVYDNLNKMGSVDKCTSMTGNITSVVNQLERTDSRKLPSSGLLTDCDKDKVDVQASENLCTANLVTCCSSKSSSSSTGGAEVTSEESDSLGKLQDKDPILFKVKTIISSGEKPQWSDISSYGTELKYYWSRLDSFVIKNAVLYRKWETDEGDSFRLLAVIPKDQRNDILTQLHSTVTAGHLGVNKTLAKVRDRYFWFALRKDVENWCKTCDACNGRSGSLRKSKAPLQTYNVGAPMERIAIDFMGPLTKTNSGNKYIMVVGDYFTKWVEAYPLPNIEAKTVADKLIENLIARFGVPLIIHTDQGKTFESCLFQELCKQLEIYKTRTTPYRPQSDGMIERANRTIVNMLLPFVSSNQKDWDEYIPLIMLAYRSSVHESTGFSPCMMMLGHEIKLPVDLVYGIPEMDKHRNAHEYIKRLSEKLEKVHNVAREKLNLSSQCMKTNYNVKLNYKSYKHGDAILLHDSITKKGICKKLNKQWLGPGKIVDKVNDVLYRVKMGPYHKPKVIHHDKLRKYTGNQIPEWFKNH